MAKCLENCKKWVNLRIQESCRWQASPYLPDVTFRLLSEWIAKGILCQLIFCYFFYDSWVAVPCLIPVSAGITYWQWRNWRRQVLLDIESGFKDWLFYIKSGLQAGKSIEQAMLACRTEFQSHVGAAHPVLAGLEQLYRSMELRVPIESGLHRFGRETGVDAIKDFAAVFEITRKQGGRMVSALEETMRHICEGIELRLEIYAMMAAKKLEQRIMCIMPFGILFFVGKASGGYFVPLYHNLQGICIMSICMFVYIFGVWWGERLTEVHV